MNHFGKGNVLCLMIGLALTIHEKGAYTLCNACRQPLSEADLETSSYQLN